MRVLIFAEMQPGFDRSELPPMVDGGRYRSKTAYHDGDSLEPCDFWFGDAPQAYRDAFPEYKIEDHGNPEYADELSDLNSNGLIELIETSDPEKLEEIKAFESEGKNRQGVMKAIAKKEAEFSEATE